MGKADFSGVFVQEIIRPRYADGRSIYLTGGRGALVESADGKTFVDFDNMRGAVLLGHAAPEILASVREVLSGDGAVGTAPGDLHLEVAERLLATAGADSVAVFKTGTEAVRAAVHAVRAYSGLPMILSAGYHGFDALWKPSSTPLQPNEHGVIDFFFHIRWLERLLGEHRGRIAAAVISPDHLYLGEDWYREVARILSGEGIPIVLDDVKLGYRYDPGPSTSRYGWEPLITVVSKGIANGFPLSAVLGCSSVMKELSRFHYTSFCDPASFAAARATLAMVAGDGALQASIRENGDRFIAHARSLFEEARAPIEIVGIGNLFQFVCASRRLEEEFYDASLFEGLLFFFGDNQCPSYAFRGECVDRACGSIKRVVERLRSSTEWESTHISKDARYDAAWCVMDGLPDFGDGEAESWEQLLRLRGDGRSRPVRSSSSGISDKRVVS